MNDDKKLIQGLTAFYFWNRLKLSDKDLAEATILHLRDKG